MELALGPVTVNRWLHPGSEGRRTCGTKNRLSMLDNLYWTLIMLFAQAMQRLSEYMTVAEAARYLGVSPSTLRNWDRTGKLVALRHPLNGYRLYRRRDLDELLHKVLVPREEPRQ